MNARKGDRVALTGCKLLECGVDWLTASVRQGSKARAMLTIAENWALDRSCEGYQMSDWKWNGYSGTQTDGISCGRRDDGVLVRLSGTIANRHWQTLSMWADNISRFDLQVTLHDPIAIHDHASCWRAHLMTDSRVLAGITRTKFTESTPDGTTLNIGSRASDRYFRVYDKTAESEGEYPERSWRYEIEYKGDRARGVNQRILKDSQPTQAVFDCLLNAFDDYGIRLPADRPGWTFTDAGIAHRTTDERRLEWLGKCIRPLVAKLAQAYGTSKVLDCLGITEDVDEVTGVLDWVITGLNPTNTV